MAGIEDISKAFGKAKAAGDVPNARRFAQMLVDYAPAPTPALEREVGIGEAAGIGFERGVGRFGSTITDIIPALLGSAVGADEYAKRQLEEAATKQAALPAPVFESYKDVEGIGDAAKFVAETMGEQIPNMGLALGTALTGGVAAPALLGGRALATKAATEIAKKEAAKLVAKQATAGQLAGAGLGSYALNAPEVFQNIFQETGELAPATALLFGAAAAALDSVLPVALARNISAPVKAETVKKLLLRSGMKPSVLRSGTVGLAKGIGTEGITEGAQEAISIAAERLIDDNPDLFGGKEWDRIMESSVRGAVAGGGFGTIGGSIEGAREKAAARQEQTAVAEGQTVSPSVTPETPPETPPETSPETSPETPSETPVVKEISAQSVAQDVEDLTREEFDAKYEGLYDYDEIMDAAEGQTVSPVVELSDAEVTAAMAEGSRAADRAKEKEREAKEVETEIAVIIRTQMERRKAFEKLKKESEEVEAAAPATTVAEDATPVAQQETTVAEAAAQQETTAPVAQQETTPTPIATATPAETSRKMAAAAEAYEAANQRVIAKPNVVNKSKLAKATTDYNAAIREDREAQAKVYKSTPTAAPAPIAPADKPVTKSIANTVTPAVDRTEKVFEDRDFTTLIDEKNPAKKKTENVDQGAFRRILAGETADFNNLPESAWRGLPIEVDEKSPTWSIMKALNTVAFASTGQREFKGDQKSMLKEKADGEKAVQFVRENFSPQVNASLDVLIASQEEIEAERVRKDTGVEVAADEAVDENAPEPVIARRFVPDTSPRPVKVLSASAVAKINKSKEGKALATEVERQTENTKQKAVSEKADTDFTREQLVTLEQIDDSIAVEIFESAEVESKATGIPLADVKEARRAKQRLVEAELEAIDPSNPINSDADMIQNAVAAIMDLRKTPKDKETEAAANAAFDIASKKLKASAVLSGMGTVSAEVNNKLLAGDIVGALTQIASDTTNTDIAKVAKTLARRMSKERTKVTLVDGLTDAEGVLLAGSYVHMTRQISLNNAGPISIHAVLHESAHAATHDALMNKSDPITQKLTKLWKEAQSLIPAEYGVTSLEEFVAEAFTNPRFQALLASYKPASQPLSGWRRFINAIFIRIGLRGEPLSAKDEVLTLANFIMGSTIDNRNATTVRQYLSEGKPDQALFEMRKGARSLGKAGIKDSNIVLASWARTATAKSREQVMNAVSMNHLVEWAQKTTFGKEATQLHELIIQEDGERGRMAGEDAKLTDNLRNAFKGDVKALNAFSYIAIEGTDFGVDVAKPLITYTKFGLAYSLADGTLVENRNFPNQLARDEKLAALKAEIKVVNAKEKPDKGDLVIVGGVHKLEPSTEKQMKWKELKPLWDKQLNKEQKSAYITLRDHYASRQKEVRKAVATRMDALTEDDSVLRTQIKDIIFEKIMKNGSIDPYFPFDRRGQFWLGFTYGKDEGKGTEYYTTPFETEAERAVAMERLRKDPTVDQDTLEEMSADRVAAMNGADINNVSTSFVLEMTNEIDKVKLPKGEEGSTEADSFAKVEELKLTLRELLLRTLPQQGLVQTQKKRVGYKGYEENPIIAFQSRSKLINNAFVNLKYEVQISKVAKELRQKAKDARYANNSMERYLSLALAGTKAETDATVLKLPSYAEFAKNPYISKFARNVRAGVFMFTLGANISAPVVNLSVLGLIVSPRLQADYGPLKGLAALTKAIGVYGSTFGDVDSEVLPDMEQGSDGNYFVKARNYIKKRGGFGMGNTKGTKQHAAFAPLTQRMEDIGLDNRTISQDMAEFDSPTSAILQKASFYSGFIFNHSERAARQITALSVYIGEMEAKTGKKIKDVTEAEVEQYGGDAAVKATMMMEELNASALQTTAPRLTQNTIGSLVGQFKRFPMNVLTIQTKMAAAGYRVMTLKTRAKVQAAEAAMAEAQTTGDTAAYDQAEADLAAAKAEGAENLKIVQNWGYMTVTGFLLLGPKGVPAYGIFAMLYNALIAGDEDDDLNTVISKTLSEGMYFGLFARITGMDITDRAALTNLMIRDSSNYVPDNKVEFLMDSYLGPWWSVSKRAFEGLYEAFVDDDPRNNRRAWEKILPAGASNIKKALRFSDEGYTTSRDDAIVGDLSIMDLLRQALGFRPVKFSAGQAELARNYRVTRSQSNRKGRILDNAWYLQEDARRDGRSVNPDEWRKLLQDIVAFNAKYPADAVTSDTLKSSYNTRARNSAIAAITGGMVTPKKYLRAVMESNEEAFRA
jgi:hypothetical protein